MPASRVWLLRKAADLSVSVGTIRAWDRASLGVIVSRSCCCRRVCGSGCRRAILAWFVIDAVAELELGVFYAAYRAAGHGRAAHDPAMMVALLLYSYAIGERSLRRIERRCLEDVATRVICANQAPDHTTIARFRQRHETALAGLFGEVLALCAEAGLVEVGVVAVDATKVHANASQHATRGYERIAAEILKEADAADAAEDERFGERRGDQLPAEQLSMGEQQALVDQWQAFAEGLAAVPGPRWISPPSAIGVRRQGETTDDRAPGRFRRSPHRLDQRRRRSTRHGNGGAGRDQDLRFRRSRGDRRRHGRGLQ